MSEGDAPLVATSVPTVDFVFNVGGIDVTYSVFADDVPKLLGWSTSEVILHLGSKGPELLAALRQVFSE